MDRYIFITYWDRHRAKHRVIKALLRIFKDSFWAAAYASDKAKELRLQDRLEAGSFCRI
jgi:hypothetical protein